MFSVSTGSAQAAAAPVTITVKQQLMTALDAVIPATDLCRLILQYVLEGQLIVGTDEGKIQLWTNVTKAKEQHCSRVLVEDRDTATRISSLSVWPGADNIVGVTTNQNYISLWHLSANDPGGDRPIATLNGHSLWVYASASLATGNTSDSNSNTTGAMALVTGARDRQVRTWDITAAIQDAQRRQATGIVISPTSASSSSGADGKKGSTSPRAGAVKSTYTPRNAKRKKGKMSATHIPAASIEARSSRSVTLPMGQACTRQIDDAHDDTVYCVVALPAPIVAPPSAGGSPRNSRVPIAAAIAPSSSVITPAAASTTPATASAPSALRAPYLGGFATGAMDGMIKIWSGGPLHEHIGTIKAHGRAVYAMCVCPPPPPNSAQTTSQLPGTADTKGSPLPMPPVSPFDGGGALLASASADGTIAIFAIDEFLHSSRKHGPPPMTHDPPGSLRNGLARAWRVLRPSSDSSGDIGSVFCVIPIAPAINGYPRLAAGGRDFKIRLWDVVSGQCLRILEAHSDWVQSLVLLPDGLLVSGGRDSKVCVWSVAPNATGRLTSFDVGGASIECMALLPESTF